MSRLSSPRTLILNAVALTVCSLSGAARAETPQDLIDEYTEDIRLTQGLLVRGLAKESSLALSYEYRGETYHLYLDDSDMAIADLTKAIAIYDRLVGRGEMKGYEAEMVWGKLPRALLFRSHAKRKKGDLKSALGDAGRAIQGFRNAVAAGDETLEPPLSWALMP